MTTDTHTLPAAIVIAGALVGLGLLLGRPHAAEAPVTPAVSPAQDEAPAPAPPRPAPRLTPEVQTRALENAARALEASRADFVRRCWDPSAAVHPEPHRVPLTFNLSFAPDGDLKVAGISEDRSVNRPDVGACLRRLELALKIPAPGVEVYLEVPFTLP